ncbi:unnamed protein product, partial [Choristocarpus tenellus]
ILPCQAEIPPQDKTSMWNQHGITTQSQETSPSSISSVSGFQLYSEDAFSAAAELSVGRAGGGPVQLSFIHFPIDDMSPASNTADLAALVENLTDCVLSHTVTYIHCWGGRGRTGLIAACLLGALYPDLKAEEALTRVDEYFRLRSGQHGQGGGTEER